MKASIAVLPGRPPVRDDVSRVVRGRRRVRGVLRALVAAGALASLPVPSAAGAAISPGQVSKHVGESVEVVGIAESVVCSPMACLLSFEAGFAGLVVAIPGDAVGSFPDPETTYEGKEVRVRGRVAERNGRPRIEVRDPGSISLRGGGASRSAAATGGEPARRIVSTRSTVARPEPVADAEVARAHADGTAADGGLPGGLEAEAPSTAGPRGGMVGTAGGVEQQGARSGRGAAASADPVLPDPGGADPATPARSRSRLVPSGIGAGGSSSSAGGRVRVEVAPPAPAGLSAADAAERLGLPADTVAIDDGAPLGGGGELALLRQEIAALVERLGEIEGAIGNLADRLAGLEDLAAPAIAERQARAESVGAPPLPASGSPGLHRVRRGFSAKQVLRLLGEPLQVEGNPNGHYTWRYEGGRVVTIDPGGVVVSAAGF